MQPTTGDNETVTINRSSNNWLDCVHPSTLPPLSPSSMGRWDLIINYDHFLILYANFKRSLPDSDIAKERGRHRKKDTHSFGLETRVFLHTLTSRILQYCCPRHGTEVKKKWRAARQSSRFVTSVTQHLTVSGFRDCRYLLSVCAAASTKNELRK